ncbi:MAG: hypothetical protein PVJ35_04020, partial [Desulfobacterales bacterium]
MLFQFVKFLPRKVLFLTLPFILVVASHHIAQASTAAVTQMTKTSSTGNNPETQVSPDLSPEKIDAQLATMDDVQVRQQLAQKLKQDAAAKTLPTARSTPMDLFYRFADAAGAVLKKIGSVFTGAHERSEQWNAAIEKLSGGKGTSHLVGVLFTTALIIAAGLFFKWLFVRSTRDVREQLLQTMHLGRLEFFGRVLSRMLLNAAGVVIYALTTFCLFVLFFRKGDPGYLIAGVYIVVSYYILLFAFAATTIFAPAAGGLRLFPLQERDATFLHRWIIGITIVAGVVTGTAIILLRSGISNQLYLLIYSWAGALVILALMIMIWQSRQRVAEALLGDNAEKDEKVTLGQRLARNWHYLAILYVLLLGIYWVYEVYLERDADIVGLIASIFIIPVFIGLDQWGQRLLKMASGELTEIVDLSDDALDKPVEEPPMAHSKMDIQHYIPLISRCLRIFLVLFLFFVMLRLWGIDLPFGRLFTRSILSILITVVLGLITWQIIKARIDRKLKEEMPESDEDMEEG